MQVERQVFQECAVPIVQLLTRPHDRSACDRVERDVIPENRLVMVAHDRKRTFIDQLRYTLHDPHGVGPITDEVAEENVAIGIFLGGVI